jgi:hypothetical protein
VVPAFNYHLLLLLLLGLQRRELLHSRHLLHVLQ